MGINGDTSPIQPTEESILNSEISESHDSVIYFYFSVSPFQKIFPFLCFYYKSNIIITAAQQLHNIHYGPGTALSFLFPLNLRQALLFSRF